MTVQVTTHPKVDDGPLGQIYQAMACKQALLLPTEEGFTRITPLVLCRDFLVDAYTFDEVGRDFEIYGMHKPVERPSREGVFLLLTPPDKKARNFLLTNISFIHNVEIINGFKLTQIDEVEGNNSLVVSGDKKWLMSCLSLSLYSSLLRVACYELGDNWIETMRKQFKELKNKATDAMLVSSVSDATWDRILSDLSTLDMATFTGFDAEKEDLFTIHHNQGFYSIFGNHRELHKKSVQKNLHWQHFSKEGYDLHTKAA
jgi:hypothetical protein